MPALLFTPVRLAPNKIVVICENKNTVDVFVDKAKGFVEIERHADRISGEPLEITLDFRNVVFDNDLTDLSR